MTAAAAGARVSGAQRGARSDGIRLLRQRAGGSEGWVGQANWRGWHGGVGARRRRTFTSEEMSVTLLACASKTIGVRSLRNLCSVCDIRRKEPAQTRRGGRYTGCGDKVTHSLSVSTLCNLSNDEAAHPLSVLTATEMSAAANWRM